MNVDIIIVGAGTAGMTSAIYALRNNKSVLMLESTSVGGQIAFSPKVENFPSYQSISGSDFSNKLFEQVLKLGANFELETVTAIVKKGEEFVVGTDVCEHTAKCVIIANGVKQKHLPIEAEERLLGNGVYYCAICDGAFYKGKEVAVIGDGNTALQSALLLSSICSKVYVLTLTDKYFGDQALIDQLKKTQNIETLTNTNVVDFLGDENLTAVKAVKDGKEFLLEVPAAFVAIGQIPDNERFANLVDLDKDGYIVTNASMQTKTPGVFGAGDTTVKQIRQLTTAVSDGAVAAMSAIEFLRK